MGVVRCGTRDDGAALTRFGVLLALTVVATYHLGKRTPFQSNSFRLMGLDRSPGGYALADHRKVLAAVSGALRATAGRLASVEWNVLL